MGENLITEQVLQPNKLNKIRSRCLFTISNLEVREKLRTEDLAIQSYIFTVSTPVNCFELVGSKKTTGQQILKEVLQANVTKYENFTFP